MPHPALIALTSPLIATPVAQSAVDPVSVAAVSSQVVATQLIETQASSQAAMSMIALEWSLSASALQQQGPADEPAQTDPQEDEGAQDQPTEESADEAGAENQIVVTGEYGPAEGDPVEEFNAESYRITQDLDEALVEPVADVYRDGLPDPLRDGLGNVVKNLGEPNNALNFLLQGKVGKTFETLGRLLINSTLGLGGLIDIAEKPGIGLPHRRNGFGNTMGFYGVGPGPYLYLPLTGATTARDLVGSGLDQLLLPVAVGKPFNKPEFTIPFYVVSNLDARLEFDEEMKRIDQTIDPYAARRDSYLYRRARDIAELRGVEPPERPPIMDEVEGTGDFADPPLPPEEAEAPSSDAPSSDTAFNWPAGKRPIVAITRPR